MAPSSYDEIKNSQPSTRAQRDLVWGPVVGQVWEDDDRVYGAGKIWKAARRGGHDVSRDHLARPMRSAGIEGVPRTTRIRTTRPEASMPRHPDLVGRDVTATAPNQLWVTDLTFVPTWAGDAYLCFIIDAYSPTIVRWRVASHLPTTMVLDGIEMAKWSRGAQLEGLRWDSDAGSHVTSIRSGERLAEIGAVPSIGTVGDSYDNAVAETVNGHRKAKLIRGPTREERPWKTVEDRELGPLAQPRSSARLPGRRSASRVREDVLRSRPDQPHPGRNPTARVSNQPSAIRVRRRT